MKNEKFRSKRRKEFDLSGSRLHCLHVFGYKIERMVVSSNRVNKKKQSLHCF